ncbi:MAG: hypothetical protein WCS70_04875 [Verrucomicrobiota bacterium]
MHTISKQHCLKRLNVLIRQAKGFEDGFMVHGKNTADCEYWFSQVVTLIQSITSIDQYFYEEALLISRGSKRVGGISCNNVRMMRGFLRQLRDAIRKDHLVKLEDQISAADFADFLAHAKFYADNGKKMESSVIASAIFEDAIKRIARKNKIEDVSVLDSTLNALKSNGVFSAVETKKYKFYAGIRNSALHASWEEFELNDAKELVAGTQKLIEEFLSD